MLTEIYLEALLVDEKLADQVWEAWDKREIDDELAISAWSLISLISTWMISKSNEEFES